MCQEAYLIQVASWPDFHLIPLPENSIRTA
jgi:hypothetical protein